MGWLWLAVAAWYLFGAVVWYTQILRPIARWSQPRAALFSVAWPLLYAWICALQFAEWWRGACAWWRGGK